MPTRAADDLTAIREAHAEIARREGPRCLLDADKALSVCLTTYCNTSCPRYEFTIAERKIADG